MLLTSRWLKPPPSCGIQSDLPQDTSSLQDLYLTLDEKQGKKQATYVLQTLWRDLTSDLDIIGPYYTSDGPFSAKFMVSCVFDALRKFHIYSFQSLPSRV